jgi:hypothetical protein
MYCAQEMVRVPLPTFPQLGSLLTGSGLGTTAQERTLSHATIPILKLKLDGDCNAERPCFASEIKHCSDAGAHIIVISPALCEV